MELLINEENSLIRSIYDSRENYIVVDSKLCSENRCIIFFSGNGLYFPDTIEEFEKTIIEKDRYEWKTIGLSEEIKKHYKRIVFVRDVYKTWYEKGISKDIDSIDKLIDLLRNVCAGYSVVTCGNSAGGYIATIIGNELQAEHIWNFGGQWTVETRFKDSFIHDNSVSKYYDIRSYANSNVLYFYGACCERDVEQYNTIKDSNAIMMPIKSEYHGDYVFNRCLYTLLGMDEKQIQKLIELFSKRVTDQRRYAFHILKGRALIAELWKDIVRHHKSLQILCNIFRPLSKEGI